MAFPISGKNTANQGDGTLSADYQKFTFRLPAKVIKVVHDGASTEGHVYYSFDGTNDDGEVLPGDADVTSAGSKAITVIYLKHNGTAVNSWHVNASRFG